MPYINPTWSEINTATRENRSAEHGSLFTHTDPSKIKKESPLHPIIPKGNKWNGKYAIRPNKRRK
jgi:hypothetical protein